MGYIDKIQLGTEVYDIHDASAQAALQTKRLGPGNNVTTEYGKDGLLMQQVVVDIEPAQAGSGDPSPSNIRAISGYGSVSVTVSPTNDPTDGTTYTSVMPESNRTFGPADVLEMDGLTGGRPMSSVVVDIEPVQSGSGEPSPTNVRPISGHSSVSVARTGKNLYPGIIGRDSFANNNGGTHTVDADILTVTCENTSASSGVYSTISSIIRQTFGTLIGEYTYSFDVKANKAGRITTGISGKGGGVVAVGTSWQRISFTATFNHDGAASGFVFYNVDKIEDFIVNIKDFQLELGSTATAYEPYQGDTFTTAIPDPPGTVYGGTLDLVSGELVVDRAMVDLGNITWTRYTSVTNPIFYGDIADGKKYYPAGVSARITCSAYPTQSSAMSAANFSVIGDKIVGINQVNQNLTRILVRDDAYTSVSDFTTAVTGVQLVYELATPVTYQCTPEEIATLAGTNVLASNAGQVTATAPVPLNVYGGTLNMTTGELLSDMALGQMTYSDLSGLGDQYIGYSANVTALGGKPAVWVRNWKYNDAPQIKREIKSGGIKGVCNAFQVHIHDKSINGSQFRIYFEVDNNITSTSDFITAVQTLENNGGGLYIAYELASPTTYQCAPQEITTLAGTNYITCNAGKVAATVPLDAIEYVDGMIGSVSQARADTYRHLGMSEISLAWENGSINSSGETTDGTRIREIGYFEFINDVVVICDPGYLVAYRRYTYNGTTYTDGGGSNWASSTETVRNTISNNYLRFVIMREDGNTIGIDEAIHVHFYGYNSSVNELFNNPSFHNVCHRGFNQIAPENTIPAFEFARKVGFRYIETDIQFTSDDEPVILHDRSIKRVAGLESDVFIDDLTLAQAREYDVGTKKNALYAGTKIPTFEEMLLWCKRSGVHPYIELKNETATEARIKSLVPIVREYGMLDKVTWISFNLDLLDYIHDVDPKARLGHLVSNLITSSNVTNLAELRGDNEVFFLAYPASGTFDDTTLALALAENIKVETCVYDTVAKYEAMHHTYSGNVTNGLPTTRLMWLAANGG